MQITLELTTGSNAGKTIIVKTGQTLKVGRVAQADFLVLDDPMLSNVHFALSCDATGCKMNDLGSRFGTLVNGKKVSETILAHGDTIVAGRSSFTVRIEATPDVAPLAKVGGAPDNRAPLHVAASPPVVAVATPKKTQSLRQILCAQPEPLFALLDAARDPAIVGLLRSANEEYQSLYEEKVEVLAPFGPYLVRLPGGSALLETLALEAWGKSWGLYLTSAQSFKEVRKHFRRFLLVKLEGGREVYFRFYDPRVLQVFLPTCTPQEVADWFGPVGTFFIESGNPALLLKFTKSPNGAMSQAVSINPESNRPKSN